MTSPHSGDELPLITPKKWVDLLIAAPLPRVFTYEWPDSSEPLFGQRVLVQFGSRQCVALVYQRHESSSAPSFKTKPVLQVLDDGKYLTPEWRKLVEFAAAYYHYPLGLVSLEVLPKALRVVNAKGQEPVMARKGLEHANKWLQYLPGSQSTNDAEKLDAAESLDLNKTQREVIGLLTQRRGFGVDLLYGVTGSGKTEVYLNTIEACLAKGGQVMVLLPEINLTPAAMALYEKRLAGFRVVVLHSNLAELPRTLNWYEAACGRADVVISTRLGVFTPLPRLGLIVVDEEHDPSYRQQEGMKYNARDIAVMLGKQRDVPVVLGSATPSLESWLRSEQGVYRRLTMTERAVSGASLPTVELVNTANFKPKDGLCEPVVAALKQCFEDGKQSIVFLNRRGFAPQMACDACGWVASCQHCSVHTVWHKQERRLRCHHCGAYQSVPHVCPDCGNQDLKGFGRGTQRIEEVLQALLPEAKVLRIDADSTRNKGQIEELLQMAHSGEAHVLVGTQMIAKGHDFANVGLVVALNVDASLFSHAYRAPERLFAQLMQVAGRAGRRGGAARMMVQTRYPHHPLFESLLRHDYEMFARFELQTRKESRMPPFSFQALLRADHRQLQQCMDFLVQARAFGESLGHDQVFICDPVPLTVVRVAGTERAQMLVEAEDRASLHAFLDIWLTRMYQEKTQVRWFIEVDPAEL